MTSNARAAVFSGVGQPLALSEFALPAPQGSEVLVEVVACTLCGSDLHSIHGRRTVAMPTILGHEILGRIVEFGPQASHVDAAGQAISLGDRVTWSIVASCGACFYCHRGLPQKCEHQTKYGHEALQPGRELTGGLADHCLLVAGTALFRIPDEVTDAVACPANCATATIAAAMDAAGSLDGRNVLIMGAGMLGVTATAWARANGAAEVIVCDVDSRRLALAEVFGATQLAQPDELSRVIAARTGSHGVDAALELTGSPDAFEQILSAMRIGGTVVLVGSVFPSRPVPLLLEQIVRRCLTLRGVHNYAPQHLQGAIEFLARQDAQPFGALVAEWRSLDEINDILTSGATSQALRIGIRP